MAAAAPCDDIENGVSEATPTSATTLSAWLNNADSIGGRCVSEMWRNFRLRHHRHSGNNSESQG